jgi:hypothetical protein
MSRYEVDPVSPDILKAVIGWDRPLRSFFIQVFKATAEEPDEGEAVIWLGTSPGELATAADALDALRPYAHVPATLEAALKSDMADTIGRRDGPHQSRAKLRLFGR